MQHAGYKFRKRIVSLREAKKIVGKITAPKELMLFTVEKCAEEHCPIGNSSLSNHKIFDGLREFSTGSNGSKNKFSANIPSVEQLQEIKYLGLTPGRNVDRSTFFKSFGSVNKAPMISECSVNTLCILVKQLLQIVTYSSLVKC